MKGYKKTSEILGCIAVWLCLFAFVAAGCSAKGGNSVGGQHILGECRLIHMAT